MQTFVTFFLFITLICCALAVKPLKYDDQHITNEEEQALNEEFAEWFTKYEKDYSTVLESEIRFKNWKQNKNLVDQANKDAAGLTRYELNHFADLSTAELRAMLLMDLPNAEYPEMIPAAVEIPEDLPTSFNWTDQGAVTPVKNQYSCGTCWSFSTTGSIEGQWFLAGNTLIGLSEEQLVDCDYRDCGAFGGWPWQAMDYIIDIGGLSSEATYPYCCGAPETCYPCMADHNKTFCGPGPDYCNRSCLITDHKGHLLPNITFGAKITDWTAISTNETEIAAELYSRGPLSACLYVPDILFFYKSGVFDPPYCADSPLDHAILIAGYGIYHDIILGDLPYWLIKNSWGTGWGMDGYFMIRRDKGKCGINTAIVSAIVNK